MNGCGFFLGHGLDAFGFRRWKFPSLRRRKLQLGMGMPKFFAHMDR